MDTDIFPNNFFFEKQRNIFKTDISTFIGIFSDYFSKTGICFSSSRVGVFVCPKM